MNNRMPFYPSMPGTEFHNGYRPPLNWSNVRLEGPANSSWERNNRMHVNAWKRNRNWQYRDTQPYTIPNKKQYNGRYVQNRYENGSPNFREINGQNSNWIPNKKIVKLPNSLDHKNIESSIPGTVATKKKRKPMSKSYPSGKWNEQDAILALNTERDFTKNMKNQSLIIRFPDPELNKDIVKQFHSAIENVHFPQASTPRYCFAHLEDDADLTTVVTALEKIKFGQGFLSVEIKKAREESTEFSPKDIDPYTLYVGNLPMNVTKVGVVDMFPVCTRVDIGHPQQMKNTRYAFVRFANVEDAITYYKKTRNTQYESRSLIVRFRRVNGNVGVPGTPNPPKSKSDEGNKIMSPVSSMNGEIGENSSSSTTSTSTKQCTLSSADLSLVKEEPLSDDEVSSEIKSDPETEMMVKKEVKLERSDYVNVYAKNEDEVDDEVEEEYDVLHDNFQYNIGNLDNGCGTEESEDEEIEEEEGMELNANNTWVPEDDDYDMY